MLALLKQSFLLLFLVIVIVIVIFVLPRLRNYFEPKTIKQFAKSGITYKGNAWRGKYEMPSAGVRKFEPPQESSLLVTGYNSFDDELGKLLMEIKPLPQFKESCVLAIAVLAVAGVLFYFMPLMHWALLCVCIGVGVAGLMAKYLCGFRQFNFYQNGFEKKTFFTSKKYNYSDIVSIEHKYRGENFSYASQEKVYVVKFKQGFKLLFKANSLYNEKTFTEAIAFWLENLS